MKRLQRSMIFGAFVMVPLSIVAGSARGANSANADANRANRFTTGLDLDEARRVLQSANQDEPAILLEKGHLAIYEGDYDGALTLLTRPEVAALDQGGALSNIARGCARVTAATIVTKDAEHGVEIRYQDEADSALTPLLVETIVRSREALTRDLGVTWPVPTRVIVVRDLLSLSAVTGLPYQSAKTTGTVAVAKWGRVTLLSPRASHHGYAWRDTVAHELTHLAITRQTIDRAPLWLQEGLAKREETRWRAPGPFDDRPSPDAVAARGIALKLDIPLDKLGPSIAMLPSADAAMVAFAEVTSFVRFYAEATGADAIARLLQSLRAEKTVDEALVETTGMDRKGWDARWRTALMSEPHEPLPAFFGLGLDGAINVRDLRERVRLAELLMGQNHPAAAMTEIAHAQGPSLDDPSVRYVQARALEALGREAEAEPLVANPKDVGASYGPWWAVRGRLARHRGDEPTADSSFAEAVAADPLDAEAACEVLGGDEPRNPKLRALCGAARARREPGMGND